MMQNRKARRAMIAAARAGVGPVATELVQANAKLHAVLTANGAALGVAAEVPAALWRVVAGLHETGLTTAQAELVAQLEREADRLEAAVTAAADAVEEISLLNYVADDDEVAIPAATTAPPTGD